MKPLQIGDIKAKIPVVQGGMGVGVSLAGLAGAVANEEGIGVISTAGVGVFEHDYDNNFIEANNRALRKEIKKARKISDGVLGVNIMVAFTHYAELVKTAVSEGIDIIFAGAGLPLNLPQYLDKNSKTKIVPIVSSGKAARIICSKWKEQFDYMPDAFVIEGPKAGGHLGFRKENLNNPAYSLEVLLPEVIEQTKIFEKKFNVKIPVIAAGGIYTGADIKKIMNLGASGVQLGTRFVTTHECDASLAFKQTYIKSKKEDIEIINSPVGMPGRAIKNRFIEKVRKGEKHPVKCPYRCLTTCDFKTTPYCIAHVLANAMKGDFDNGFAFAGVNAYKATEIISVKQTFDLLIKEYNEAD